ncbi:MAG TPA: FAD-dependent oxidoreductase [Thermoanaerobaculia bacterium]|nr:FAD-dependent oxidoreductase [Thermoanaerobaculia bacterium]
MKPERSAEVVILGAGVMGASVAWHLASRGCRDVLVLDREPAIGLGSTGRATGGFRTQFATEVNIRLSLLSREKLLRFPDEIGADSGYRPYGYLFLANEESQIEKLRSIRPLQRGLGVPVEEITPEDARRLNPAARLDGIVGGSFCPFDGFIRPLNILNGYAEAARRLGVRFEFGVEVTGFGLEKSLPPRVMGVETTSGPIAARHVVNASGAWAGAVGRLAGTDVPVFPLRRQVAPTEPTDVLPEDMPMTIFLEDGFHLRVRDGRVLLLWPQEHPSPHPFDTAFDESWLPGLLARAHARIPALAGVPVDRAGCWAGLYEMSPDEHALVGKAPGVEGLWLINGSSGHGVMHSPALGQLVAEMILDGRAETIDAHALRPSRFAEQDPNPDFHLL